MKTVFKKLNTWYTITNNPNLFKEENKNKKHSYFKNVFMTYAYKCFNIIDLFWHSYVNSYVKADGHNNSIKIDICHVFSILL